MVVDGDGLRLERYIVDACGKAKPRLCFVPTASGDDPTYVVRCYESYGRLGVATEVLRFFRRTPAQLGEYLASFDIVHVGGGNTRSMLAVWRHWGFDAVLRDAWQRGTLLCGSSAGSICWFEQGVTDSLAGALVPMPCLGFLAGSNCRITTANRSGDLRTNASSRTAKSRTATHATTARRCIFAVRSSTGRSQRDRRLTPIASNVSPNERVARRSTYFPCHSLLRS